MAMRQTISSDVTHAEIVACAHVADFLIQHGHRTEAINLIDAIHTAVSLGAIQLGGKKANNTVTLTVVPRTGKDALSR